MISKFVLLAQQKYMCFHTYMCFQFPLVTHARMHMVPTSKKDHCESVYAKNTAPLAGTRGTLHRTRITYLRNVMLDFMHALVDNL